MGLRHILSSGVGRLCFIRGLLLVSNILHTQIDIGGKPCSNKILDLNYYKIRSLNGL